MILNYDYWTNVFQSEFSVQLSALVEALEERILPAFGGIEEEAMKASRTAWNSHMLSGSGDEDPGNFAENAEQVGVSYYMLLDGTRQGILNLFAAALYHAFEQQILLFHRMAVLRPEEQNDQKLFTLFTFKARLKDVGIDVAKFDSWSIVDELRLVANTVKHAEGNAATKLHALRPDLFEHPKVAELGGTFEFGAPRVFQPLVGEDLYVSIQDVLAYRDALLQVWQELAAALSGPQTST